MSEDTLETIYENITELQTISVELMNMGKFGASIHFSIAAREECSKYLLVYCRQHLPDDHFKKRFQHLPKHRISAAAYYIIGKLSVVHFIDTYAQHVDNGEWRKQTQKLIPHLLDFVGRGDPSRTAEAILRVLQKNDDAEHERATKADLERIERDRTGSIYVDVADDLSVAGSPRSMTADQAAAYLEKVAVSLSVLSFLRDPHMSLEAFIESLPPVQRAMIIAETMKSLAKPRGGPAVLEDA